MQYCKISSTCITDKSSWQEYIAADTVPWPYIWIICTSSLYNLYKTNILSYKDNNPAFGSLDSLYVPFTTLSSTSLDGLPVLRFSGVPLPLAVHIASPGSQEPSKTGKHKHNINIRCKQDGNKMEIRNEWTHFNWVNYMEWSKLYVSLNIKPYMEEKTVLPEKVTKIERSENWENAHVQRTEAVVVRAFAKLDEVIRPRW